MNFKQSLSKDFHSRTSGASPEKQVFLDSAFSDFIKNAATFQSRDDFNQHIQELERAYFKTSKIE